MIAILLTTAIGEARGLDTKAIANASLKKYSDDLGAHEQLQLIEACVRRDIEAVRSCKEGILQSIALLRNQVDSVGTGIRGLYAMGPRFDLLAPILVTAAIAGDTDLIADFLMAWKRIDVGDKDQNILYCMPAYEAGNLYACANTSTMIKRDTARLASECVDAENLFLGTTISLTGNANLNVLEPERRGVPIEENSTVFIEAVRSLYGIDELARWVRGLDGAVPSSITLLPYQRHPIQALLLRDARQTFPYSSTFVKPTDDRKLSEALIWIAGSFFDEEEASWVSELLERGGIRVTRLSSGDKRDFIEAYASSTYDLIWIVSHWEHDDFEPHGSYLPNNDKNLTVEDWSAAEVPSDGRRLLVLNMCNGALAATLGGTADIGLAHLLASQNQAVVSHLWPVNGVAAEMFGILLAGALVENKSHFAAYTEAHQTIMAGQEAIRTRLERLFGHEHDVLSRLDNSGIDWQNAYFWASPLFLQ